MLLVTMLVPGPRIPTGQARTAAVLLFIRSVFQSLREAFPDYLWELLDNPAVMPECVRTLMLS
ncbi:hypothetical protein OG500_19120 [Kitasatospora sp. NBC_01250]|uniref:hypothetical protein n=1 Tax=Kitasatospora sp. NBC_01250 TaxID=2903571 RepID=UPI002E2FB648|nr:hypothetical protein [Kitasatospora sp. NBC_01250]